MYATLNKKLDLLEELSEQLKIELKNVNYAESEMPVLKTIISYLENPSLAIEFKVKRF